MTTKLRLLYIGVFLFFVTPNLFSQNDSCVESIPICAQQGYTYPGVVNAPEIGSNHHLTCIAASPNPSWFHMLVLDSGAIVLKIVAIGDDIANPFLDVDFECWGPFDDPVSPCDPGLNEDDMVDCSYSADDYEICEIPEAIAGKYYILVITNYQNEWCDISITQIEGEGALNPNITSPQAFSNSPVCESENLELGTADYDNAVYSWTGPNGFTSDKQTPVIPNATPVHSGTYELVVEMNDEIFDAVSTEVMVVENPVITVSENIALPYNTSTQLHCYAENGAPDYSYFWTPAESLQETNVADPYTIDLIQSTTFNVYVRDNNQCTSNTEQIEVTITSGVNANNLISDSEIEVYPNPASNEISVQLPDDFKEGRVEIYQTDGTLVFSENIAGKNSFIDVSEFSRGSYLIRVSSESKVYQKKIVLIK